jgi:iron complex outermembrane receptor protein
MHRVFPFIFLFILSFSSVLPTHAKEKDSKHNATMEEVVVKGEKFLLPNQSDVDIKDSTVKVSGTPVDVMQHEVGLDIQRKGLMVPNSKMIKLRGFDTEKTLVAYDGRPLNGAGVFGGYQIDWSQMPLVDVDSIEIQRGALSAEYGNTIGGVINLVPKEPQEEFQLLFGTGYKSYDTRQINGFMSGKFNPFSSVSEYNPLGLTLGASYMDTNGYLRNTESDRKDFSPSLYFYFPDEGFIRLGLRYSDGEFETPITNTEGNPDYNHDYPHSQGSALVGPGIKASSLTTSTFKDIGMSGVIYGDDSYYEKERYEWDILIRKKLLDIDWEARYYQNYEDRTDKYYARADVGTTQEGDLILDKDCPADDSWGVKLKASKQLQNHHFKVGGESRSIGYDGIDINYFDNNYLFQNFSESKDQDDLIEVDSFFISDRYTLLDNLEIYLGLRYDDYEASQDNNPGENVPEDNFDRWSPSIGLYFEPTSDILTYATFARTAKFPIIPKYYWYYNGLQPGMAGYDFERSSLKYEEVDQYEAGIEYTGIRDSKISLSYYYYKDENYLRWIFGYPRSRVVYNMDEVTISGTELSLQGRLLADVYGYANWTWQETDTDGAILADKSLSDLGFPKHKVNFGLRYEPMENFLAKLDIKYVDDRDEAQGPLVFGKASPRDMDVVELDEYWLVNAMIKYPLGKHWRVYGGIENLLNENYEETNGFPMPGRMYFAGLEWEL